jgi:tetratricopeptide (TPR) repeat protein
VACDAAETLWLTQRTDWIETIERNLREKVVEPDFRYPMMDGRLALARLCALQGRYEEAVDWFARARTVLDEQEARPLRAIVDYDQALMYARRGADGDRERARPLLDAALAQFTTIGMPGWIRRAEHLRDSGREYVPAPAANAPALRAAPPLSGPVGLRREGEVWTLACGDSSVRLKDSRGLRFLAHLLRNAGQEFHVLDLVGLVIGEPPNLQLPRAQGGTGALLDSRAKAEYRARVEALREEIEEAEQFNDHGRAERAREELEAIAEQLAAAVGLGGRDREAASAAERARSTVTQRLKAAIGKIAAHQPALGTHLDRAVKTGTFCVYSPDPSSAIAWQVD